MSQSLLLLGVGGAGASSGGVQMQTPILGRASSPSTSAQNFGFLNSLSASFTATEANVGIVAPVAFTLKTLTVVLTTAPGSGKSWAIEVYKNGSASGYSLTIADANTTGTATGSLSVAAGDRLSLSFTPSGTPTSAGVVRWYSMAQATNSMWFSSSAAVTANTTGNQYFPCQTSTTADPGQLSANIVYGYLPTSGTIRNLQVYADTQPGGSASWDIRLWKNSATTSLVANVASASNTGSDTTNSVTVVAGDTVQWRITANNTPTATRFRIACEWVPDIQGESVFMEVDYFSLNATTTLYNHVFGGPNLGWDSTEANRTLRVPACIARKLYATVHQSPGAGTSYIMSVRKNAAATALTATIADTNTSATDSVNSVSFSDQDLIAYECDPENTPTVRQGRNSIVLYVAPA